MYEKFILQQQLYAKAIQILVKGYLPISFLGEVQITIHKTNPDYDLVIKHFTSIMT